MKKRTVGRPRRSASVTVRPSMVRTRNAGTEEISPTSARARGRGGAAENGIVGGRGRGDRTAPSALPPAASAMLTSTANERLFHGRPGTATSLDPIRPDAPARRKLLAVLLAQRSRK